MSDQRVFVCELLRLFYDKGWVSGTGGGICALESPGRLLLAPTGVHKERVRPEDLFVVDVDSGDVVEPAADASLRPSECNDIFRAIIRHRGARSVVHSHALSAVLACDGAGDAITIERLEMLKGIPGLANTDRHLVPVVENTPREPELTSEVERVLDDERFAMAHAIGVRNHGAYLWGADSWEAKKLTEVYHFLFEATNARGGR
ncbi:MAG: methylthioribulose 1-phosphate dehydratase [Actinomycetota bacterium]